MIAREHLYVPRSPMLPPRLTVGLMQLVKILSAAVVMAWLEMVSGNLMLGRVMRSITQRPFAELRGH